ncbi:MAG: aminotransferase class I/II-fold pyridoxal phosphate-dependent enzyme [Candidatus Omnitrophica bacterium]|nr:aminotransferase class I/II-fold pyridoxal phosphate-dependent enzyme [Candidatus Omnitrophota bacterium]
MSAAKKAILSSRSIQRVQRELRKRTQLQLKRDNRRLFHEANRLKRLPLYLFTILDELKAQACRRGVDVIDLGMGSPDLPPPRHVVEELIRQSRKAENHGYSRRDGVAERRLHEAIMDWYQRKFKVSLDSRNEVLPLIGSKEGISHLSLAFLNHDDIALVPNPTYPVHFNGVVMAGGILYNLPIHPENHYLPDLHNIPRSVLRQSKMLFLSYPHNPTTAVADLKFFKDAVAWAKQHRIMIVHDFAYSDIVFDGYRAPSIMEVEGAKEVAVEFHTLSKSYSLPGLRLGFSVGNRDILASLAKTKSYVDFGIFRAVQWAAIKALSGPQDYVHHAVATYEKRRSIFTQGLRRASWDVPIPKGTFYVWAKIPLKFSALTSLEFATLLVQEAGVVAAPGSGFGEYGEGFVRFALVAPESRLSDAVARIKKVLQMAD